MMGALDRETNTVSAAVVENTRKGTVQDFMAARASLDATIYTVENSCYQGLPTRMRASVTRPGRTSRGRPRRTASSHSGRC